MSATSSTGGVELFDSHIHLDDPSLGGAVDLSAARRAGVGGWLNQGLSPEQWPRQQQMAEGVDGLWLAVGMHPHFLCGAPDSDRQHAMQTALQQPRVVAIGEIGLDFRADMPDSDWQLPWLRWQLRLARERNLPVCLHAVKALDPLLRELRRLPPPGGVIHAFRGSAQQLQQALDLGLHIGVGGTVTHARAQSLRRLVRQIPAERLLLETDAPFQAPSGLPRDANRPEQLARILIEVAELRAQDPRALARQTLANTRRLLFAR